MSQRCPVFLSVFQVRFKFRLQLFPCGRIARSSKKNRTPRLMFMKIPIAWSMSPSYEVQVPMWKWTWLKAVSRIFGSAGKFDLQSLQSAFFFFGARSSRCDRPVQIEAEIHSFNMFQHVSACFSMHVSTSTQYVLEGWPIECKLVRFRTPGCLEQADELDGSISWPCNKLLMGGYQ